MNANVATEQIEAAAIKTEPRLTLLLSLKGRYLFTLRFLWQANQLRLPYRILIADGQVHPAIADVLQQSRSVFPNIDVEYVKYPDDEGLGQYYSKLADAAKRVRTPYAMMVDNDDFVCQCGTENALAFLDENSDYVAAAGSVVGFSLYSGLTNQAAGLTGRLNRIYRYYGSSDLTSPSAADRLRHGARNLWSYYAVYRTEALATINREIAETNFSDLLMHELYYVMRALTLGKIRLDESSVGYLRQYGTSTSAGGNRYWARQLVRGRITDDVRALVERISSAAAEADACPPAKMNDLVFDLVEAKFRQFLNAAFGTLQEMKGALKDRVPSLVSVVANRPRVTVGRERTRLMANLKSAGAASEDLAGFQNELSIVEDTISGNGFAEFVRPYLGELHPSREHLARR